MEHIIKENYANLKDLMVQEHYITQMVIFAIEVNGKIIVFMGLELCSMKTIKLAKCIQ